MIRVKQKGDFSKITRYLKRVDEKSRNLILEKYGRQGVEALRSATPVDSGKTANSWFYEIQNGKNGSKLTFSNSNVNKGVQIAIILQYGHGTGTGGWVEGRDYINPAIQPIFDEITSKAWKELIEL